MTAISVPLAEAVKDHIAAQSAADAYRERVDVERVNVPIDNLEDMPMETTSPIVTVFAGERTTVAGAGRDVDERRYLVAVALREKQQSAQTTAQRITREDELIELSEEIEQSLTRTGFELTGARAVPSEVTGSLGGDAVPLFADHITQFNQFVAVTSVRYTVIL